MDLTTALQETLNLLKRKEAIERAYREDLIDLEERDRMLDKVQFEYGVLRTIYLLPAAEYEIPETSETVI